MYIVETHSNADITMAVSFNDKAEAVGYALSLRRPVRIWHEQEGGTVRRLVDIAVDDVDLHRSARPSALVLLGGNQGCGSPAATDTEQRSPSMSTGTVH